jgi:cytochrome c553
MIGVKCIICHGQATEYDHLKTRGSGGSDDPENLVPMCRACHSLRHQMGIVWLADRYPKYKAWIDKVSPGLYERHLARRKRTL